MLENISYQKLDQLLEKFYEENFLKKCQFLRIKILDAPKQAPELLNFDPTRFRGQKEMKLKEKKLLAIFSWYFPEEIRWLIQFWLSENWGGESKEVKEVLLTSKETSLGWLIIQKEFNNHDFFGNYLKKTTFSRFLSKSFDFVPINLRKKVKKYTGYCRGYQDNNRTNIDPFKVVSPKTISVAEKLMREIEFNNKVTQLFQEINEYLATIAG